MIELVMYIFGCRYTEMDRYHRWHFRPSEFNSITDSVCWTSAQSTSALYRERNNNMQPIEQTENDSNVRL